MAHNLYKNTMLNTGANRAWHKLGVQLDNPATSEEALNLSGLNYEVVKVPVRYNNEAVDGKFFTINTETNQPLGIVGDRYEVVNNREAVSFMDAIVQSGDFRYTSAGALGKGERIWLLGKLPTNIVITPDDVVEKYICLTNSHDGSKALQVFFTPIRVVCQNTLNMALKEKSHCVSIRHTKTATDKIDEARKVLGLALDFYDEVETDFKELAETRVSSSMRDEFFARLLKVDEHPMSEDSEASTRKKNIMREMSYLADNGAGNKAFRGSAWSLYNGVTEYVDHYMTVKGLRADPSKKAESVMFGAGARKKEEAFNLVMEMVKL